MRAAARLATADWPRALQDSDAALAAAPGAVAHRLAARGCLPLGRLVECRAHLDSAGQRRAAAGAWRRGVSHLGLGGQGALVMFPLAVGCAYLPPPFESSCQVVNSESSWANSPGRANFGGVKFGAGGGGVTFPMRGLPCHIPG